MNAPDSSIRYKRIVIAGLLAQLVLIIVLVATITVYNYLVLPSVTDASISAFSVKIAPQLNLYAGTLATLGMAYWAARKPETNQLLHGLLTGLVVIAIDLAILASPESEFQAITGLAMALKLTAGITGGFLAMKHYQSRSAKTSEGHRII